MRKPTTDDLARADLVSALARQARAFKLVAANATRLLLDERPEELIRDLFLQLGEHLGLEIFVNYLISEESGRLHLNACGGVSDELCGRMRWLEPGQGVCGAVAQRRERIILEDAQRTAAPMTLFIREMGIDAYACFPLLAHGKLIGTLAFGSRSHKRFDPEGLELMQVAADQVAIVLERKRLRVELQRRADELAEANAAKDRFLAVLSHELRTPLTPVLIAASTMGQDAGLPEHLREDMAMIRRNIELEARLIDDLLDLTRISRGKLQLQLTTVDALDLLRRAIEMVRPDAEAKSLTIEIDHACPHHHVHADSARLQQVFWNLLKNAVKFTPAGGVIVVKTGNGEGGNAEVRTQNAELPTANRQLDSHVGAASAAGSSSGLRTQDFSNTVPAAEAAPTDFSNASPAAEAAPTDFSNASPAAEAAPTVLALPPLTIQITDTGVGIDPQLLPRLFNAFEQGECPTGRHHGGLGLGLAISRALIDVHGGQLHAASEGCGCGATFRIDLPTVPPPRPAPPDRREQASAAGPLRILLVEDHPTTAAMMSRLLRSMGHEVRVAGSVHDALDAAAETPIDLVISDIGLPDGTGHELMRQLRNHLSAPAIAVSGFGMENDIASSMEAGFAAHLTKPVSVELLESTIRKLAEGHVHPRPTSSHERRTLRSHGDPDRGRRRRDSESHHDEPPGW